MLVTTLLLIILMALSQTEVCRPLNAQRVLLSRFLELQMNGLAMTLSLPSLCCKGDRFTGLDQQLDPQPVLTSGTWERASADDICCLLRSVIEGTILSSLPPPMLLNGNLGALWRMQNGAQGAINLLLSVPWKTVGKTIQMLILGWYKGLSITLQIWEMYGWLLPPLPRLC